MSFVPNGVVPLSLFIVTITTAIYFQIPKLDYKMYVPIGIRATCCTQLHHKQTC